MIRSKWTALMMVGLLSISSLAAFAQSTGRDAPVDKGGMPPYSEMNAGTSKALPPGTIGGVNGGDANGSGTNLGEGSGSVSGGSSMGSGFGGGSGGSGGSGSGGTDRTDGDTGG